MANNNTDYSKYVAIFVSVVALGYTFWKDRKTETRLGKVEKEQERERQETAIRRSKASAPFFSPSTKFCGQLYDTDDDNGLIAWPAMKGNILSINRKEFPKSSAENSAVILLLDVGGKGARRFKVSGDIPNAELRREPDIRDAHGLMFLKYPYLPSKHGQVQKVVFSFETDDGFDLTHTYETRHGHFEFSRTDPK